MTNKLDNKNVYQPSHYNSGEVECIDAIKSSMTHCEYRGYLKGNAMKYLWRYDKKGKAEADLLKCHYYLSALIGEIGGNTTK